MTAGLEGSTLGRYRLIDRLGAGRQGTVYRAHDPVIDRPVAVKVAHAGGGGGRMFVEAQMAASLHHPNITAVYDAGSAQGLDFIVTELVPHHLSALAHAGSRADLRTVRALAIVRQCAEALAHAHARGILHRDIKPSNVLIDPAGQVRLTDFGLALPADGEPGGPVCGTPAYLAPEAVTGAGYNACTDLYALGVLLFELLTGTLPFPTDCGTAYRRAQSAGTPRPLADYLSEPIPVALQRVVDRCLAPRQELRYRSASDLIGDLMVVQEWVAAPVVHTQDVARAHRLTGGEPGLGAEEAATLARLGDWRRLAGGQRLPAMPGADACLVWVTLGSLALRPQGGTDPDAERQTERCIEAGACLLLPAPLLAGLVARAESELLILDDARLGHLPEALQRRLLRAAALAAWTP